MGRTSQALALFDLVFWFCVAERHHEMGWIGRRIACQMMKTADYLAVNPLFSARALLARDSRGERGCKLVYLAAVLVFISENEYY